MKTGMFSVFALTIGLAVPLFLGSTVPVRGAEMDRSNRASLSESFTIYLPLVLTPPPPIYKIAFHAYRDGQSELYVVNSDGTNLIRLVSKSADIFGQDWSPDGSKLVFTSGTNGGGYEIYKVLSDGSKLMYLTSNSVDDWKPRWSPDGSKIVYISNEEIWKMNADGSGKTRLTHNTTYDDYPSWSPDGTKIAYTADGNIYLMDANGHNQTQITSGYDQGASYMDWSPDGNRIAFQGEQNVPRYPVMKVNIYVVNVDGSGLLNLTDGASVGFNRNYFPKWSPNGKKIAYECFDSVCSMDPNGANIVALTSGWGGVAPDWSPDGSRIVFASALSGKGKFDIYLINSDGSGLTALTADGGNHVEPLWQP